MDGWAFAPQATRSSFKRALSRQVSKVPCSRIQLGIQAWKPDGTPNHLIIYARAQPS